LKKIDVLCNFSAKIPEKSTRKINQKNQPEKLALLNGRMNGCVIAIVSAP